MKLTQLVATAAAATLLLAGCSTTNVDADGNAIEPVKVNPNAGALLGYIKGGNVETADPATLNQDLISFWSLYTDEEIIAIADEVCALMTQTAADTASTEDLTQAFVSLVYEISSEDIALEVVERSEDRIKRVAMFEPAAQIYCTEHKETVHATVAFLEKLSPEQPEAQPELTQLEQLNLDLSEFLSRYSEDGIIISEDGLTLNGYIDLNGDNIIGEDESVQTFQLPEGYTYSETIGTTPAVGDSYGDGNLNDYSKLTVVEE
jgi:hypothetical protein